MFVYQFFSLSYLYSIYYVVIVVLICFCQSAYNPLQSHSFKSAHTYVHTYCQSELLLYLEPPSEKAHTYTYTHTLIQTKILLRNRACCMSASFLLSHTPYLHVHMHACMCVCIYIFLESYFQSRLIHLKTCNYIDAMTLFV